MNATSAKVSKSNPIIKLSFKFKDFYFKVFILTHRYSYSTNMVFAA